MSVCTTVKFSPDDVLFFLYEENCGKIYLETNQKEKQRKEDRNKEKVFKE